MRLILAFAAPLLFGFLFQQLYSFVDTAIVGRFLGAQKLAAVGATGSLSFMILGFCSGLCSGFSIPIAQAFGARDETALRRSVTTAVCLCAGFSLLMAVLTALLCPLLLRLMNTPEAIIGDSAAYIRIIFAAIPFTVLYNMSGSVLRSLGDSRTPVIFLVFASATNILLDLLFILVFRWGVAGAGAATAISQLLSGLGCLWAIRRSFPILRMSRSDWIFRPQLARRLIGIGIPMGLQFSITAVGSVVMQWSVNGLGVNAVAAMAAGARLSMFFACVFDALATTMATYAGQNIGAGRPDRIGQGLRAATVLGVAYCLAAFAVIMLRGRALLSLFVDEAADPAVTALGLQFLRSNGAFYIPLLFVNLFRLTVQGVGCTRPAMFAGMFEMAARIAVALVLVPLMGFDGAVLANPAAWVLADLFLIPCYFTIMRHLQQRLGQGELRPAVRERRV